MRISGILCELPNLGGEAPTATLNFSKGSATVLMQYYMFLRLGRDGFTRIMRYALDHAMYLRDRLIKSGKFQIMNQAQRIPVVALTLDESVKRYNDGTLSFRPEGEAFLSCL
jgi:glutamate decarboxylase